MTCVICSRGTMYNDKASFTVEKDGAFIVFSNVEAAVCDNCGEAYFSTVTAEQLQAKAEEEFKKGNEIELVKF